MILLECTSISSSDNRNMQYNTYVRNARITQNNIIRNGFRHCCCCCCRLPKRSMQYFFCLPNHYTLSAAINPTRWCFWSKCQPIKYSVNVYWANSVLFLCILIMVIVSMIVHHSSCSYWIISHSMHIFFRTFSQHIDSFISMPFVLLCCRIMFVFADANCGAGFHQVNWW